MSKLELPHVIPEFEKANCGACRLNCNSRLQLAGAGKRKILLLFDSQDSIQQATKTYFCGSHYTYVRDVLYRYGVTSDDVWMTSTIQCYTDKPEESHAIHCRPNICKMIKMLKPALVIGFGELTAKVLLSDVIEDGIYLDRVHGLPHPSRKFGCMMMMFTYMPHPSTYKKDSIEDYLIRRDIHIAMKSLQKPFPSFKDENQCVRVLSPKDACRELRMRIDDKRQRFSALDYETNCLKPYNSNSKLISCAISESEDDSFSFMIDDETAPLLREYWLTPHIKKIAQNSAFERTFSIVKLGVVPFNLRIDTMLMAHALDNRDIGWLSIKFLAPMLTGCALWNKHIESMITSTDADKKLYGEYALNKIEQIPQRQMLVYNAIDALVEFRVFRILSDYLKNYYSTFPSAESIEEYHV